MSEKVEISIAIANCSGRSNIGQMSLEIARRVDRALPYANIRCLPALWPNLKPAGKFFEDDAVVVIDGCKEACVLQTVEKAGLTPILRVAPDETFGVEKQPGLDFDEQVLDEIAEKVIAMVREVAERLREQKRRAVENAQTVGQEVAK